MPAWLSPTIAVGNDWGPGLGRRGRRVSEVLGVGLSASYILASGVVKSIGKALMNQGVPEFWMPFVVGMLRRRHVGHRGLPAVFVTTQCGRHRLED